MISTVLLFHSMIFTVSILDKLTKINEIYLTFAVNKEENLTILKVAMVKFVTSRWRYKI